MEKKMGRPTLRGEALTDAEKKRRQRARIKIRNKVAEVYGYKQSAILLNRVQLLAMAELCGQKNLTSEVVSIMIFEALKSYLESKELEVPKRKFWPKKGREDIWSIDTQTTLDLIDWEANQQKKSLKNNEVITNAE